MNIEQLCQILKNATSVDDIDLHRERIIELIPEIEIMIGYDQHNYAHQYDLWYHSLHTVLNLPRMLNDDMLYLAALLHDIGKPDCRCDGKRQDDENWHYYGHPEKSCEIVSKIVGRYSLSQYEEHLLLYYILHHDYHMSLRRKHLRKHMKSISFYEFKKLMMLEVADAKAHILISPVKRRIEVCSCWTGEYADLMLEENLKEDKLIHHK